MNRSSFLARALNPKLVLTSLLVAAALDGSARAANLLVNGSFETYTKNSSTWSVPGIVDWNLPVGSTGITGWTVTRQPIDYYTDNQIPGGGWVASDGHRSLDLAGTPGNGGVSQAFATQIGATYQVTFDLSGNPDAGPTLKTMRATVGTTFADFSYDNAAMQNSDGNMKWVPCSFQFVATSPTTTLELYNTMGPNQFISGPAIDNVSVSQVPEPAAVCILGLGASALLARRSNRAAAFV